MPTILFKRYSSIVVCFEVRGIKKDDGQLLSGVQYLSMLIQVMQKNYVKYY